MILSFEMTCTLYNSWFYLLFQTIERSYIYSNSVSLFEIRLSAQVLWVTIFLIIHSRSSLFNEPIDRRPTRAIFFFLSLILWDFEIPGPVLKSIRLTSTQLSTVSSNFALFLASIWKLDWAHFNLNCSTEWYSMKNWESTSAESWGAVLYPKVRLRCSRFNTLFRSAQPNLTVIPSSVQTNFQIGARSRARLLKRLQAFGLRSAE